MDFLRPLAALTLVLLLAGCTGEGGSQVGISSQTDSFSYGGQVAGKSGSQTYDWTVTGNMLEVQWGGQVASGSVQLTVKDGTGATVYSHSFGTGQGGLTDEVHSVKAGKWTVKVDFKSFTGQMGLHLDSMRM